MQIGLASIHVHPAIIPFWASPSRPSRPSRRTGKTAAAAPPPSPRRDAAYDFC